MPLLPSGDSGNDGGDFVFPPVAADHIQNCSYDAWFPKYRSSCIKSRIIPLPPSFLSYLHEDGILLADEDENEDDADEDEEWTASAATRPMSRPDSDNDDDDDDDDNDDDDDDDDDEAAAQARLPPNKRFPETHNLIKDTIAELGGSVAPKLNWSSPKDAKWISPHQNTLKCTTPNDIYLLLKSSSFVSHDFLHAFDGCVGEPSRPFQPVLVLRPFFNPHVALEFRCFVKDRSLVGITQRDLNYYAFLDGLRPQIRQRIQAFFRQKLRLTFPDSNFAFDVYIPESYADEDGLGKVRLIDINPWDLRTDSLLFGWEELLQMEVRKPLFGSAPTEPEAEDGSSGSSADELETGDDEENDGNDGDRPPPRRARLPEVRFIEKDDPAAFNFSSTMYSAHKLPKEVVDASLAGEGGLREFAQQWKNLTEGRAGGIWEQPGTTDRSR